MSWQAYVDNLTQQNFTAGGVIGKDGAIWAISDNLSLSLSETKAIVLAFDSPSSALASGLSFGGSSFICVKVDERSCYLRKGTEGVCIVNVGKCILVGTHNENSNPGTASNQIEMMADYLVECGFGPEEPGLTIKPAKKS